MTTTGTAAAGTAAKRALGVIRLSVAKDESTSPERQRELIEAKAAARGSTIIDWATDPDISASKVHPFKRPELGRWLTHRYPDYDEVIFWRIDRLVRKVTDMGDMIEWAKEHSKELVSATEPFDTDSPMGKIMVYLITMFAEMESDATRTRVTGAHAYLRKAGRWAGGAPPYGYQVIPNPDGPGYVLAHDPVTSAIIRDVVDRIINQGHVVNAIVADLNNRKIPSPRDYVRTQARRRRPRSQETEETNEKRAHWQATSLRKILRSRALRGEVIHRPVTGRDSDDNDVRGPARTVTGTDGMPLTRAEPLISESDWGRLQQALDSAGKVKKRWQSESLLLGVAFCLHCDSPLYRWERVKNGRTYRNYRCRLVMKAVESDGRCNSPMIRCEELDETTERHFLALVGNDEIYDRVWQPGEDHTEELEQVKAAMERIREERDSALYDYPGGEGDYRARLGKLVQRRKHLESLPQREAAWTLVPTGQTFADRWREADVVGRRELMRESGFRVLAGYHHQDRSQGLIIAVARDTTGEIARTARLAAARDIDALAGS